MKNKVLVSFTIVHAILDQYYVKTHKSTTLLICFGSRVGKFWRTFGKKPPVGLTLRTFIDF